MEVPPGWLKLAHQTLDEEILENFLAQNLERAGAVREER